MRRARPGQRDIAPLSAAQTPQRSRHLELPAVNGISAGLRQATAGCPEGGWSNRLPITGELL